MNSNNEIVSGSCLCGGVQFELRGTLRPVVYCHCKQCRRTSGHFVAATACPVDGLELHSKETLSWFRSSDTATRGFCRECGSSLFWQGDGKDTISVMAGALSEPTGLEAQQHIFVADAGDYYDIGDDLPCAQRDELSW